MGEDAGARRKEVAVSFSRWWRCRSRRRWQISLTPLCTVGRSHPATASSNRDKSRRCVLCYRSHRAAVQRQTDRKVALSLKKLQVSKRSGGRNVARRRSSPRKRAGSIDESFRLPAHSFHSCTLIHGLGVFKVSTGLRVASTRISLKEEATERCPAPRRKLRIRHAGAGQQQ